MSAEGSDGEPAPRRGRPRKWSSEAERKRAYRARKAEDLAEPERLRTELRDARSQIRRLEGKVSQLEGLVRDAERRVAKEAVAAAELEVEVERREVSISFWEQRARIAERRLQEIQHPDGHAG